MKTIFPYTFLLSAICCFVFVSSTTYAQSEESPCKTDPVYQQQDFKLGVWDVRLSNGQSVGEQRFEKEFDDCVIKETWTGNNGRIGSSYTYYNPVSKYWHQTFVDNQGNSTVGYGRWKEEGKMTFTGRTSKGYYLRWTLTRVSENEMIGTNERSDDLGETWRTLGDVTYVRK
jgi:hypothetical protein